MKIKIRDFKEEDTNFIISTWIKSSYAGTTGYRERLSVYHKGVEALIKKKHESGDIFAVIACLDEDPDIILGFGVFGTDYTLHYVCTKEAFKRQGICKSILKHVLKGREEVKVSFWTKDIPHIQKIYKVTYDRFKFFN